MRGVKSFAMVLCVSGALLQTHHLLFTSIRQATSKDGKDAGIELIQPPAGSKPGERVYFEGSEYESEYSDILIGKFGLWSRVDGTPLAQLNPKKKIFEAIQPGFITLDTKEAAWVNPTTKSVHKIRTKDGVCVSPTLVGASLS